jgi:hypothetical protein
VSDESRPSVDPRFDPIFQRGYDPALHPAPAAPSRAPWRLEPVDDPVALPQAAEDGAGPPNPWRRALLLTSAVLLVAAVVLLWALGQRDVYSTSSSRPDAAEVMVQQLSYQLPPALIIAGAFGVVLWVALGAVRSARR